MEEPAPALQKKRKLERKRENLKENLGVKEKQNVKLNN
jgi:hypothetical protein